MGFKIKTAKLKEMLTHVSKGVGNNKVLPITSFIELKLEENELYITATDMNNYITVMEDGIEGEDMVAVLPAEQFIKLVNKTTTDEITISVDGATLYVKGNGKYKIAVLEEEYPDWEFTGDAEVVELSVTDLKGVININKASLAVTMDMPCLTGYNLGERAITTDGVKMCINKVPTFSEQVLLTQELADLIGTLTADKVKVQHANGKLLFTTPNIVIFGAELAGIEDYPELDGILAFDYPSKCKISKLALTDILNRLNIFVSPYDNNGIKVTFGAEEITLTDRNGSNKEVLKYLENEQAGEFTCMVNIHLLTQLIGAINIEQIDLYYGNDTVIKLETDKVTQILCVMNEED